MTLRRRLVMLVVGLSAIGLVVSTVVGTALLRRFVLHRVDRQLVSGFGNRGGGPGGPDGGVGGGGGGRGPGLGPNPNAPTDPDNVCRLGRGFQFSPQGTLTELYRLDGSSLCPSQSVNDPGGGPVIERSDLLHPAGRAFTVSGHSSGHDYRVVVNALGNDAVVVRAIDLGEANATWRDQALAGGLISLATLVAIGGLGLWLVHRGLRPLEEITDTADALFQNVAERLENGDPEDPIGRPEDTHDDEEG